MSLAWAPASQAARNQAARNEECAAISELAALFLFQTPPTDRALAGWGVFGDEPGRGEAIMRQASQPRAADIIEDADRCAP